MINLLIPCSTYIIGDQLAKKESRKLFKSSAATKKAKPSKSPKMSEAKENAIAKYKKIQRQITGVGRPLSVQMAESFRKIYKMPWDADISKYPELQAQVDSQKTLEERTNEKLKADLARLMKENNLTKEDVKEESV
jgi:hypothetical protein